MGALNLKIFDVLTEKINVSEFENWLYNSDEFLSKIDSNSFYFDLISINYKSEGWQENIYFLIESNYDLLALTKAINICLEIKASENTTISYNLVSELISLLSNGLAHETEYLAVFDFYSLYSRYSLIEIGYMNKSDFDSEAKYLANLLLNKISQTESLDKKINVLKTNVEENYFSSRKEKTKIKTAEKSTIKSSHNGKKQNLKQKIFAFLKKI